MRKHIWGSDLIGTVKNPSISIIIPTYNRPRMLAECLRAIAADTYQNKEVIVVNDAGSDVSTAVRLAARQMPVQLVTLGNNRGHVRARNEGLSHAQGDLVMLCDDDDLLLPGHIQRMAQMWREHAGQFLYSDVEIVSYNHAKGQRVPMARAAFAFDFDPGLLRRWNTVISSGVLYDRTLHDDIGPFDEHMRDYWDWDFLLRASAVRSLLRVPFASVLYMVSALGQNLSANHNGMQRSLQRFVQKHHLEPLAVSSFAHMLDEPALQPYRRPTCILWNGSLEFCHE
ncbi:MAG: glycosyltransferase family 2 protein [Bacilli bacterium]